MHSVTCSPDARGPLRSPWVVFQRPSQKPLRDLKPLRTSQAYCPYSCCPLIFLQQILADLCRLSPLSRKLSIQVQISTGTPATHRIPHLISRHFCGQIRRNTPVSVRIFFRGWAFPWGWCLVRVLISFGKRWMFKHSSFHQACCECDKGP